jgi:hypothetical protein
LTERGRWVVQHGQPSVDKIDIRTAHESLTLTADHQAAGSTRLITQDLLDAPQCMAADPR